MRVSGRPSSPNSAPPNTGSQYFDRRGEVNELRQALRSGLAERDTEKLKDSIKKVIGYMTLGIDMSRLFSEMVMASQLGDIVQKKLVYLYMSAYAEQNSDLAILAINTLQKDTRDVDPSVRGLALRSLCSLHLANGWEYFQPAIAQGLSDPSGYVRKTAVMSLLKMKAYSETDQFMPKLLSLLSCDPDANVVSNCVAVLSEYNQLPSDKQTVYRLLNFFPAFSEYGKTLVMEKVLSTYFPESQDEMFDLMNILDVHLRQTNVSVSILILRLFRLWTTATDLSTQVLLRSKDPLLTLYSSASNFPELQFTILSEIFSVINSDDSGSFTVSLAPHYRTFFATDFDTRCIGSQKLCIDILLKIATISDYTLWIIRELSNSIHPLVAQHTVDSLVQIVDIFPDFAPTVSEIFLNKMEPDHAHPAIVSACMVGLGSVISSSPRLADLVAKKIHVLADFSEGFAAAINLIGDLEMDSTDLLESIVDSVWDSDHMKSQTSPACQVAVISTCVCLFFKFPSDYRKLVERVLFLGIEESTDPDVRDTALFYYRLMQTVSVSELQAFFGHSQKVDDRQKEIEPVDDLLVSKGSGSLISF
jgi:vesicle coat complex subunit